jgi:hypothetical protein
MGGARVLVGDGGKGLRRKKMREGRGRWPRPRVNGWGCTKGGLGGGRLGLRETNGPDQGSRPNSPT